VRRGDSCGRKAVVDGYRRRPSTDDLARAREKLENFMKNKITYMDEPMGKTRVVTDFLPSPEQLALKRREHQGYDLTEQGQS
jgi:hypothetical protein